MRMTSVMFKITGSHWWNLCAGEGPPPPPDTLWHTLWLCTAWADALCQTPASGYKDSWHHRWASITLNFQFVAFIGRIFVTNLFNKCIVLCRSYSIFFDKFIALKIKVSMILNKSLPKDFYAIFLTFLEFATIIVSLILWVYTFLTINFR